MKFILSRKGFDSSAGGVPSPILPDGRLLSLPIPDKQSPIAYGDIKFDGGSIAPLVSDLTQGRIPSHYRAHLDPDLSPESLPRLAGWRPIFGQTGAAQGHLRKNGVGRDDIFLFFGLFRRASVTRGRYGWATEAQPCHVLWGWLQIGEILSLATAEPEGYEWAAYHPHLHRGRETNNVLYVSAPYLNLDSVGPQKIPGAGVFPYFSASRQLTAPSAPSPSIWELPRWFFPEEERTPLTYHADLGRWRRTASRTELRTVARGQEFILDCNEYPEVIPWVLGLLQEKENVC
jgi:hypothetical protein